MQSQKKCRREKRLTMNAKEFAIPFAQNVGSYPKAVMMCDNYVLVSMKNANRDDLDKESRREAKRTAGFYTNVGDLLRTAMVKMGMNPPAKKTTEEKVVKKDTPDRRQATP